MRKRLLGSMRYQWIWIAGALFFCIIVSAAPAKEEMKSVWVKADEMMVKEEYGEAIKLYSIAIEMNADDPDIFLAHYNRAEAFIALGKVDEALAGYNETIRLNPGFPNAYRMRGIIYLNTVRYTDAVNDFSRFIELAPENPAGYANRGSALLHLGSYEKAEADLNKSIVIDPACAECYYIRYQLFTIMWRESEAQRDLEKAQSLDSHYKGDN